MTMAYCKLKQKQEQQDHGFKQKNNEKTANSEYALTGKIIILATTAGDLSLNFLSLTSGSTVTIMKYSAMTARKLDKHAP